MSRTDCEVYIYDLEGCKQESDDPLDSAVIYSNRQDNPEHVLIISGQLIGVAQFGLSTFGFPSEILLESGATFKLIRQGRFVLILGEVTGPDEDSQRRLSELSKEILDRLRFFRGVHGFDEWYEEESPSSFKRRLSRFIEALLSNASSYCRPERGFFKDDLETSDIEVSETTVSILIQCNEIYKGVLGGALIKENRVLYQNFPRKVFKKLQILLNEKERSLDTSFCKAYEESPWRLPIGLDVFSIFLSPEEAKELRFANAHFLSRTTTRIKRSPMEEISDAIRLHNYSAKAREMNKMETASMGFVLLVIKVDLLRLLLVLETKIDKETNLENIKRIWSVGFTKLPKFINMPGLSDDK